MDLITTYSGISFDPINPNPQDISIIDIAHCLSNMCRANGHSLYFYSVAQHCINCTLEAKARNYPKHLQLACLLHDGSEAYMADIVRPYKKHLSQYLVFEENLQTAIWEKFGVGDMTVEEIEQVFKIDDIILYNEFNYTMLKNNITPTEQNIATLYFEKEEIEKMEKLFLSLFHELTN